MEIFMKLAIGASLLGAETVEAGESGIGFRFDVLGANLINLIIVYVLLTYVLRKFLGKSLSDRSAGIETAIKDAEQRKQQASIALAEQQQKLAQAQAEAERIRASGEEAATSAKAEIMAKAEQDVQRMREAAAQDITTEQGRVMTELRQRTAVLALQRVESELPSRLNDSTQQQLIDRSIAMLGGSQ
jgi:F-type H+-transporting ATPase subunit b